MQRMRRHRHEESLCISGRWIEEIEGLTVVDVLRRAGAEVEMVSVMDRKEITGAHGIKVEADRMI